MPLRSHRQGIALLVTVLVVLAVIPGAIAARSATGGTVVVAEGETVDSIEAVAGTVVVRGTVTGDVSGLAGSVEVTETGTVEGDLESAAGEITIAGTVAGDVSTGAGTVRITDSGSIGGRLDAGAGLVVIEGTVVGDATVAAETIRLGPNAAIEGSLRYDGNLVGNREAVAGTITQDPSITFGIGEVLQPLTTWVFSLYAFVSNLLLGAILLVLFPRFAGGVADRVRDEPVRTGAIGFAVLLGIPILLVALALTIVGIPFTLVGFLLFAFVAWVGLVYGRYAIGIWLLSYVDVDNRWMALVVGMVVGAIIGWIPFLGGLLNFLIFLLGLGALVRGLYHHRRRQSPRTGSATTASQSAAD